MRKLLIVAPCLIFSFHAADCMADDFFTVGPIKFLSKMPSRGAAPIRKTKNDKREDEAVFLPSLEVQLKTKKDIHANTAYARIYFFDQDKKQVASARAPYPVDRGGLGTTYAMPALFKAQEAADVYFTVPENVLKVRHWSAVIVFGDKHAADAKVFPNGAYLDFKFPERTQVESPKRIERKEAMDPVVEYVVKTRNPRQPQITLLVRPPTGMTDASQAKGILALCALGNSVFDIKRRLQTMTSKDDLSWILRFAEKHKLLILCWGSRGLWNIGKNWDELSKEEQVSADENFREVSDAWARGVRELSRKYGFPDSGFLMTGTSGAAQYSARLALRHPEFFQAVYVHIPSSFDRPIPAANRILWCLTTGEQESGYARSLKFYAACRELGYPIVYKAIVGLAHKGSPYADKIGEAFFEWALEQEEARGKFEVERTSVFSPIKRAWDQNPLQPWPTEYRNPPYVGDAVNQEIFPWEERDMVPEGFRVPLPTKPIADAWNAQKL